MLAGIVADIVNRDSTPCVLLVYWTNLGKSFRSSLEFGRDIRSSPNSTLSLNLEMNNLFMFRKFPKFSVYLLAAGNLQHTSYPGMGTTKMEAHSIF